MFMFKKRKRRTGRVSFSIYIISTFKHFLDFFLYYIKYLYPFFFIIVVIILKVRVFWNILFDLFLTFEFTLNIF